jgi:Leucine-rich repeat (LRR) protein
MEAVGQGPNRKCSVCGNNEYYFKVRSRRLITTPDLDTRLVEPYLEYCPTCGFCAADINKEIEKASEVVNSDYYQKQLKKRRFPSGENAFICYSLILEAIGDYAGAGWSTLYAAWMYDDASKIDQARTYRKKAVAFFQKAKEKGQEFAARPEGTEDVIIVDLLRRSGEFESALRICEEALTKNFRKRISDILHLEKKLIMNSDTARYSTSSVTVDTGIPDTFENELKGGQTELDLSNQDLISIQHKLGSLQNLQKLILKENQLTELPPEISQLTELKELDLFNNKLTELPPEIKQLTNLTRLFISNNLLKKLPSEICQLTSLRSLFLSFNFLTKLPAEIGQLTNLTRLDLGNNQLTELPPEIGQLTNLTRLDLGNNQLTELPPEIGKLNNLTSLDLGINQLTELSFEIEQLTELKKLNLRLNQLTELPPEIGQLTKLTSLNLERNQLTNLPPDIGRLINLIDLNLDANNLTELPAEIGQLTKLTYFGIEYNKIIELPHRFINSPFLSHVFMYGNPLTEIPDEIKKIINQTKMLYRGSFRKKF